MDLQNSSEFLKIGYGEAFVEKLDSFRGAVKGITDNHESFFNEHPELRATAFFLDFESMRMVPNEGLSDNIAKEISEAFRKIFFGGVV